MTERRANPSPVHYYPPPANIVNLYTVNAKHAPDPELLLSKFNAVAVWVYEQDGIQLVSYVKKEVEK